MRDIDTLKIGERLTVTSQTVTVQGLFAGRATTGAVRVDTGMKVWVVPVPDDRYTVKDGDGCVVFADSDPPPPDLE